MTDADAEAIHKQAWMVRQFRENASHAEEVLRLMLTHTFDKEFGAASEMARRLRVSDRYICDVRHGRRPISETILDRIILREPKNGEWKLLK